MTDTVSGAAYRGRLAPSPTGFLHLGHARTFWAAYERARAAHGVLVLRNEDLDASRSKAAYAQAMLEDLHWLGIEWQEGPDLGGPFAPYQQSERHPFYVRAFERLRAEGWLYPCTCSRQDVLRALQAPHAGSDEPLYPGTCRPTTAGLSRTQTIAPLDTPRVNWRFRVPDGERVCFSDGYFGRQEFVAGKDFGDFVAWRHDGWPSYQLAVVVDDAEMHITEVVRGADLLVSTARQILLYRALQFVPPQFYHCPLLADASGARLAKRHDALTLRTLRASGVTPEQVRAGLTL